MGRAPSTQTAVYYSYDILVNGIKVGILQRFSPTTDRALDRIREIANSDVDTIEIVPGRSERTVDVERFETYSKNLTMALGFEPMDIGEISSPITIVETMHKPNGGKRQTIYEGCIPKRWTKQIQQSQITITETITLEVTNIVIKNV
jgi:hypothetical protein